MEKIWKKILAFVMITILFSGCIGPRPVNPVDNNSDNKTDIKSKNPTIQKNPDRSERSDTSDRSNTPAIPVNKPSIELEDYNGGFFSMKKPVGWEVITAGSCNTLAILVRDKDNPQNQIFIFTKIGPVFLSDRAKSETIQYIRNGGYYVPWVDMPVVNPFTPENLLSNYYLITSTEASKQYMYQSPILQNIEIISSTNTGTPVAGNAKIMRALFYQNNKLSEGLFHVITPTPNYQYIVDPMQEIEFGYLFTGISADKDKFRFVKEQLFQSLKSLIISDQYVQKCVEIIDQETKVALRNAKIYSDISDIYMQAWEDRNKADDIMSEKRSDAIMVRDRVYDKNTGLVYEVDPNFYDDKYNINREKYNMDLERIPDDNHDLWTSPTLDPRNIN